MTNPAVSVAAISLVGKRIADRVLSGKRKRDAPEQRKPWMIFDQVRTFRIEVNQIHAVASTSELAFDTAEQLLHNRDLKRMEEVQQAGASGKTELRRVLAKDGSWRTRALILLPAPYILLGDVRQPWMQLHAKDIPKWQHGGHENGATLAAAQIDKGELFDGAVGNRSAPVFDRTMEACGGHRIVRRVVRVVIMPGDQVGTNQETTCVRSVKHVKRVALAPLRIVSNTAFPLIFKEMNDWVQKSMA